MNPQPKTKPIRNEKYLAWIRKQPCSLCGSGPCQAAHQRLISGGTGSKPDDLHAIPLCPNCHRSEHSRGPVTTWNKKCWRDFSDKHALRDHLIALCASLYSEYLRQK